ncbi:hypothetical protein [Akkermansia sp. AKK6]
MELVSFYLGSNPGSPPLWFSFELHGTSPGKEDTVPTYVSKKDLHDFSLTDSTGKIYQLDTVKIVPGREKLPEQKCSFSIIFNCSECPSATAEWLHLQGSLPIASAKPSSLVPVEIDLIQMRKVKIPFPPHEEGRPELSPRQNISLSVEKMEDKDADTHTWTFTAAYLGNFRYQGMELEDMEGQSIPVKKYTPGFSFDGDELTSTSEKFTLPRSCKKIRVRVLYVDQSNIQTKQIHLNMNVGIEKAILQTAAASVK